MFFFLKHRYATKIEGYSSAVIGAAWLFFCALSIFVYWQIFQYMILPIVTSADPSNSEVGFIIGGMIGLAISCVINWIILFPLTLVMMRIVELAIVLTYGLFVMLYRHLKWMGKNSYQELIKKKNEHRK